MGEPTFPYTASPYPGINYLVISRVQKAPHTCLLRTWCYPTGPTPPPPPPDRDSGGGMALRRARGARQGPNSASLGFACPAIERHQWPGARGIGAPGGTPGPKLRIVGCRVHDFPPFPHHTRRALLSNFRANNNHLSCGGLESTVDAFGWLAQQRLPILIASLFI